MAHFTIIRQQELERRQRLQRLEQQIERDRQRQHAEQLAHAQENQRRLQSQWLQFERAAEDGQARLIAAARRALNPFAWWE
jgi:hypothetical protein